MNHELFLLLALLGTQPGGGLEESKVVGSTGQSSLEEGDEWLHEVLLTCF